jgi:simple sugar transport system permease protein
MQDILSILPGILHSGIIIAAPLLWAAFGGLFSERSGVINVGLEGMMLTGAFAGAAGSWMTGNPWFGLCLGITAGSMLGFLHAWICLQWRANQIVSGMGINLLAFGITGFLLYRVFGTRGNSPEVAKISYLADTWFPISPMHILLALTAIIIYFIYHHTRCGLRLRACGEDPHVALSAGIRVKYYQYMGVILSGALAGAGGVQLSIGDISQFSVGMSDGRGFIALAALISSGWKPGRLIVICIAFGVFVALGERMQTVFPQISSRAFLMMPFVIALFVLAFCSSAIRMPASLGKTT